MTATLPQLWLLDLRAYQETSRWRTLLAPVFRPSANGARLPAAGRSTARALPARLSAAADARVSRYPHF